MPLILLTDFFVCGATRKCPAAASGSHRPTTPYTPQRRLRHTPQRRLRHTPQRRLRHTPQRRVRPSRRRVDPQGMGAGSSTALPRTGVCQYFDVGVTKSVSVARSPTHAHHRLRATLAVVLITEVSATRVCCGHCALCAKAQRQKPSVRASFWRPCKKRPQPLYSRQPIRYAAGRVVIGHGAGAGRR
jgi:hypothetical protein